MRIRVKASGSFGGEAARRGQEQETAQPGSEAVLFSPGQEEEWVHAFGVSSHSESMKKKALSV